jgi:hypothetical protein
LSYTRIRLASTDPPFARPPCRFRPIYPSLARGDGGGGWIRTNEDVRRQIYSLLPLTTRQPLRGRQPTPQRKRRLIRIWPRFVNPAPALLCVGLRIGGVRPARWAVADQPATPAVETTRSPQSCCNLRGRYFISGSSMAVRNPDPDLIEPVQPDVDGSLARRRISRCAFVAARRLPLSDKLASSTHWRFSL